MFKWESGPAVAPGDFGSPDVDTNYALCIYDHRRGKPFLAASLQIPADPIKWKRIGRNKNAFNYRDSMAEADGVRKVSLKPTPTKSKVRVDAKGVNIPMPTPLGPTRFLNQDDRVTVQLVNDTTSICFGADFTSASRNDGVEFKATAP